MNTQFTEFDEDSFQFVEEPSAASATIETDSPVEGVAAEWTGPRCEKCSAPLKSDVVTVCRRCGWYASLNQFVEVDQDWEVEDDTIEQPREVARPSHVDVWLNLLPRWAWIVIATLAAIAVESVAVRLATPAGSSFRMVWSLTQLAVGLLAFAGCHVFNFLVAAAEDADFGALDLLLKPLKLWMRAAKLLPEKLWVADGAAAGLMAALMSLVVIGGLPYDRLWDWGFEKPNKQNLMGAVASRMQQIESEEGADNLEDAVADFAGTQNLEPGDQPPPPPPKPREMTDCVILGYRLDAEGRLTSLVLGTAFNDKLVYAGSITPKLSEEEEADLVESLAAAKTDQPFLTIQVSAIWVEPTISCRVSYVEQHKSGSLQDPRWEKLLGNIRLP